MLSLLLKIRLLSLINVARQTAARNMLVTAGLTTAGAALASGRLAFSQAKKSGEYQIITGAWVP